MTGTATKSTVLVKHHLKQLKLPTMHGECEKVAARSAQENLDHLAFLLALCELELVDRERRAAERRLKAAKFPAHKTLDEFDFAAQPSVNKPLVLELLKGEYCKWQLKTRAPGGENWQLKSEAHNRAACEIWEDGGGSRYLSSIRTEAQECTQTCNSGPKSVAGC